MSRSHNDFSVDGDIKKELDHVDRHLLSSYRIAHTSASLSDASRSGQKGRR